MSDKKETALWAQMWIYALGAVVLGWIVRALGVGFENDIIGGVGVVIIGAGIVIFISGLFQFLKTRR